jgi:hypothetical protein
MKIAPFQAVLRRQEEARLLKLTHPTDLQVHATYLRYSLYSPLSGPKIVETFYVLRIFYNYAGLLRNLNE